MTFAESERQRKKIAYHKTKHLYRYFRLRIDRDLYETIRERAQSNGQSTHAEILDYVEWGLENGHGKSPAPLQKRLDRND